MKFMDIEKQQQLEKLRPRWDLYQALGIVQGTVTVESEDLIMVGGFPLRGHNFILDQHDGREMVFKFWPDEQGYSRRIRKQLDDVERYGFGEHLLLISAYVEPGTGKLVVPFLDTRKLRKTVKDVPGQYRLELDLDIKKPDFPVLPGRKYDLLGRWVDNHWLVEFVREIVVPEKKRPKFDPWVRHVSVDRVKIILDKHKTAHTNLNSRKTEPLQAYVAAYRDLPEPLKVRQEGPIFELQSGIRGLIVAKRFGLETVPVSDERWKQVYEISERDKIKNRKDAARKKKSKVKVTK